MCILWQSFKSCQMASLVNHMLAAVVFQKMFNVRRFSAAHEEEGTKRSHGGKAPSVL